MPDLYGVEVFAVGTWVGNMGPMKWIEEDMDMLVANTTMLMGDEEFSIKPKLKIGHDPEQFWEEAQIIDGQYDGDPSLARITNFRTKGMGNDKRVVCDFLDIVPIVYDVIVAGLYRSVSAEIEFSKGIGWFISAVALLGADIPAVKKLDDLQAFLSDSGLVGKTPTRTAVLSFSQPKFTEGAYMPTFEEGAVQSTQPDPAVTKLLADNDKLRATFTDKEAEVTQLKTDKKALQEEVKKYRQQNLEATFSQQKDAVLAPYKKDVEAKKLMPALLDKLTACLDEQKASFTDGSQLAISPDLVREVADAYVNAPSHAEQGQGGGSDPVNQSDDVDADVVLARECKILMNTQKMTYSQAANHLQLTKPEIFENYVEWTEKVSSLGKHKAS